MANSISFYLNGEKIILDDPDPTMMLVDYLRSPEVGLTGTKKPCGQGGCGGCTVILSEGTNAHRAINSCLRPVCALDGLSVTTIEGTGEAPRLDTMNLAHRVGGPGAAAPAGAAIPPAIEEVMSIVNSDDENDAEEEVVTGMNPVAHKLAVYNGSQCGFCSVGFVMNMSEFLVNHRNGSGSKVGATRKEIEEIFDGNLCRCTGYRPILAGMKEFSTEARQTTIDQPIVCVLPKEVERQLPASLPTVTAMPVSRTDNLRIAYKTRSASRTWIRPTNLTELRQELKNKPKARLVRGNTSFGIYKDECLTTDDFIDIGNVTELKSSITVSDAKLTISAGTTYSDLLSELTKILNEKKLPPYAGDREDTFPKSVNSLHAIWYMTQRTAGRIVRNAASIGGNAMLVLRHVAAGSGEPFPSDLFTALVALNATVKYWSAGANPIESSLTELMAAVIAKPTFVNSVILESFSVLISGSDEVALSQKVALREVNSHAIVNATTLFTFDASNKVTSARIAVGGILPYPFVATATEKAIQSKTIKDFLAGDLLKNFGDEILAHLRSEANRARMSGLPNEGFTDEYRTDLAVSLLYRALIHASAAREKAVLDPVTRYSYVPWGRWPASVGKSVLPENELRQPIGEPYVKSTAMLQTSGRQHYTQDLPVSARALNGAFVQSTRALGQFKFKKNYLDKAANITEHLKNKYPDTFIDLVTWKDIPAGGLQRLGMGMDQPIFAGAKVLKAGSGTEIIPEGRVMYVGQALALVIARTERDAIHIADYVTKQCVDYGPVIWGTQSSFPLKPILSIDDAIRNKSVFPDCPESSSWVSHIWRVVRKDSEFSWLTRPTNATGHTWSSTGNYSVTETTQYTGGQAHFYMETQSCVAEPGDDGIIVVRPSSQSPMEMHQSVAMALGVQHNHVSVEVFPLGGGFGGKTEQARFVTAAAAVAARKIKRPVRIAMPRDEDTAMVGKRHAYKGTCQVAIDRSSKKIVGLNAELWGDGGAFYDCSFIVSNCIQLRTDNAYNIPNFQTQIDVCRTNTAPSTAMRSFGDVQAKIIIESAIENAAIAAGFEPDDVRVNSFYRKSGDTTPFGQSITNCYIGEVWKYLKENAKYDEWKESVVNFNKNNKWRKRGLAMLPVKYGSGYNLVLLEQATAVLSVNSGDGSVVIHQGGVEMGQGLITQARQVAAQTLNIPMEMIRLEIVRTSVIPNPSSSGASTGTPYACEVTKLVCAQFVAGLSEFIEKEKLSGQFSSTNWQDRAPNGKLKWQNLIDMAYSKRHKLVHSVIHPVRGGEASVAGSLVFKRKDSPSALPDVPVAADATPGGAIDSFAGFTYSAACSEVEVDILTGETKIIRSEIVYDMGKSLNPALDVGQVEGAFVQGAGYLTSEMLAFENSGDEKGRLNATNTWRYKIPSSACIPQTFNVYLFPRSGGSVQGDLTTIDSAKEVGEPPLVLAISVFFAIKDAIRHSRVERKLPSIFDLRAPATVQEIRRACEVSTADLKLA